MLALDRRWIPRGNLNDDRFVNACHKEDLGEFKCYVIRDASEDTIRGVVKWVLETGEGKSSEYLDSLSEDELRQEANQVLNEFWQDNHGQGVTCDFGGIAFLVEQNRTITDDDNVVDDDEYMIIERGLGPLALTGVIVLCALVGGVVGFVVAMRTSKGFNRRVRTSILYQPLNRTRLIRTSLKLDAFDKDYEEIPTSSKD
jgi:hypothetical protein